MTFLDFTIFYKLLAKLVVIANKQVLVDKLQMKVVVFIIQHWEKSCMTPY